MFVNKIMVSDEKFQEIIDKTDMVSLVGEFVELTKKGSGYFGLCPFHDDSSPSFSVSVDKKIAKCMSCGGGGNPVTFLKKIKKISTNEAISILAQRAGVKVDLNIAPKKEDKNKKYYDIYQVAQEFYTYNLFNSKSGKKALDYLYKRGLTEETIKMFGIGLAPDKKDTLTKVLIDNGFLDIDCIEIGLVKNNGTSLYDIFMNRIMFPITNENGQTIAFSGRLYDGSNGPKYVNTMETIIYRKGDHLYNLSNAVSQINKTKRVILCEGQMDVIKISNANHKDVICALGSALTSNQVKLIKKYASNVVLAYDNDNAGIKATKTAINLLKGINVDVLQLPNGIDPDEFISQNSVEAFNELFDKRINSIEFIYNSYFIDKNIYSLVHVEEIKNDVFKYIKTLSSNTIKEQLFNKLSNDLKINYDSLLKDYNLFNGVKVAPKNFQNYNQPPNYNMNNYNSKPVYNEVPADVYANMAPPPDIANQVVSDYIPDAPPMNYNDYQPDYSNMAPPMYEPPMNYNRPSNQPINNKPINNNYNNNSYQTNVVKSTNQNNIAKGLQEACKTLIGLAIYNYDLVFYINELLDGNDDFSTSMPSVYGQLYSHLMYVYENYPGISKQGIWNDFIKNNESNKEFEEIIEYVNIITDDSKNKRLVSDAINFISKQSKKDELVNKLKNTSSVISMNENIKLKKEIDKK
ncbi:MAG: DNA primase [bacterium]